jgi:hypothetical protein
MPVRAVEWLVMSLVVEKGRKLTSCTETCHHTSNEDEIRALGGGLECTSHKSEDGSIEETVDSSDTVGGPTTDETADNCSRIVLEEWSAFCFGLHAVEHGIPTYNAHDTTLLGSVCHSAIGKTNLDLGDIVWRCVDTTHDTLIISFEED